MPCCVWAKLTLDIPAKSPLRSWVADCAAAFQSLELHVYVHVGRRRHKPVTQDEPPDAQAAGLLEMAHTAKHLTHLSITFYIEAHVASYLQQLQQLKRLKSLRLAGICTTYMVSWMTHLSSLTGLTSLTYHHNADQTLLEEDATALHSFQLKAFSVGQILLPDSLESFCEAVASLELHELEFSKLAFHRNFRPALQQAPTALATMPNLRCIL